MAIPLRVPVARAPRLVLAWAAAMAQRLDLGVKWPNDLVDSQDRKLGGMLAELELSDSTAPMVLLGVGLNVHQQKFPGLPGAASLSMLGHQGLRRTELLAELIGAVDAIDQDTEGLLEPWRRRSRTLGRRVRVGSVEGVAWALREDGALLVDEEVVLAGDVEMVS
jgi:BirA family biotin operon repressor/biotin-[acetyl-CoA-carboxylase] ligase